MKSIARRTMPSTLGNLSYNLAHAARVAFTSIAASSRAFGAAIVASTSLSMNSSNESRLSNLSCSCKTQTAAKEVWESDSDPEQRCFDTLKFLREQHTKDYFMLYRNLPKDDQEQRAASGNHQAAENAPRRHCEPKDNRQFAINMLIAYGSQTRVLPENTSQKRKNNFMNDGNTNPANIVGATLLKVHPSFHSEQGAPASPLQSPRRQNGRPLLSHANGPSMTGGERANI